MKVFLNGLSTGLVLQMAIGPVFFFIVNLVLQQTLLDGFAAVLAVTLVDYFYISLSIFGVGKLLEKKKIKKIFGVLSSVVLIIFGALILSNISTSETLLNQQITSTGLISSFLTVFFLTISSPMTIVFFTGIFSAKALEFNYTKHQLLIFGLAVGLATFIFMGSSVIVFFLLKKTVPILLIQIMNGIVGILLILYGLFRFKKVLKNSA